MQIVCAALAPLNLDNLAKISVLRTSLTMVATSSEYIVAINVGKNLQLKKVMAVLLSLHIPWSFEDFAVR